MKIQLHKPQQAVWWVAVVLFVLGLFGGTGLIPLLGPLAFWLTAFAAGLLVLGTWVF
jgi:hypothetical protein